VLQLFGRLAVNLVGRLVGAVLANNVLAQSDIF
jgi:hypothetical protein